MSIMLAAGDHELDRQEHLDLALRTLLDHVAAELAEEYIRLMDAAAGCEATTPMSVTDA